jgi:hypothetical protein
MSQIFLKPFYPLITRITRIFADYFWDYSFKLRQQTDFATLKNAAQATSDIKRRRRENVLAHA